jgi:hypothetical protein
MNVVGGGFVCCCCWDVGTTRRATGGGHGRCPLIIDSADQCNPLFTLLC